MSTLEIQVSGVVTEIRPVESLEFACEMVFLEEKMDPDPLVYNCLRLAGEFFGREGRAYFYRPALH